MVLLALLLAASGVTRPEADRLVETGRFADAADAYFALLQAAPKDVGLLDAMGQTLRRLRRPDAAVRFFRAELTVEPSNRRALRDLGATLQEANAFDEGREILTRLTVSEPAVCDNWYRLGLLMYQNGYYPSGIDALDRALACGGAESNRAEVVRAMAMLQAGLTAEAGKAIPALLAKPENARDLDLLISYVQLLCEAGDYANALKQDAAALLIAPENASAHFWRARILQQQNQIPDAVREAETARRLSPGSPAPRNLLVRLYRRQGRAADAEVEADWLRHAEAAANGRQTGGPPQ